MHNGWVSGTRKQKTVAKVERSPVSGQGAENLNRGRKLSKRKKKKLEGGDGTPPSPLPPPPSLPPIVVIRLRLRMTVSTPPAPPPTRPLSHLALRSVKRASRRQELVLEVFLVHRHPVHPQTAEHGERSFHQISVDQTARPLVRDILQAPGWGWGMGGEAAHGGSPGIQRVSGEEGVGR